MIVLAVVSFVTSYFVFYQLTNKVDTKTLKTSTSVVVKSTPTDEPSVKTIVIGDGQGGTPAPSPSAAITPDPVATIASKIRPTATPIVSIKPSAIVVSETPVATIKPVVLATPKPIIAATPYRTAAPIATLAPRLKQTSFKVRVGAFDSKSEAERKSKELEGMGYDVSVIDEPEGSYIQLGAFKDQERALALAEEVNQKGFSVIIRQVEE